jgi:biopolymer transport protein ExbD
MEKVMKDLKEVLLLARTADPKQTIVLKADKAVKFNVIYKVMTVMKEVRFEQVQMVTMMER